MITYKVAKQDDLQKILDLLKSVRGDTRNIRVNQLVVAKEGNDIVGCVRIKELSLDCLELASLGVVENYRRQGIGIALVKAVLRLDERRPVYLLCFRDNETFYNKCGFKLTNSEGLPQILQTELSEISIKLQHANKEIIAMKFE